MNHKLITQGVSFLLTGTLIISVPVMWVALEPRPQTGLTAAQVQEQLRLQADRSTSTTDTPSVGEEDTLDFNPQEPPVAEAPAYGKPIGVLHLPSLNSYSPISEGVGLDVLDRPHNGHFPDTAMPGEVGNFAIAGHRNSTLEGLKNLKEGHLVVVETADGYFTYEVTEHYIVPPTQVEVVAPVPNQPAAEPTERLLTLVTCYPDWSNTERRIIHATFKEWQPLEAGTPEALL